LAEWRVQQSRRHIQLSIDEIARQTGHIYEELVRDVLRRWGYRFDEEVPIIRGGRMVTSLDVKIEGDDVEKIGGFFAKNIIVEIKYSIHDTMYERLLNQIHNQLGGVADSVMLIFCEKRADLDGFDRFFQQREHDPAILSRVCLVCGFSDLLARIRPQTMPMEF
jgi:hypothetical protein